jgi:UPF0271 protein
VNGPLRTIDLNADLGEGFPNDEALMALVTSASLACGGHAGDESTMRHALSEAARRGVVVGAHPGFADREGFGRREQTCSADLVETLVLGQVARLSREADALGVPIRYIKPHGALYNQAQRDRAIAEGVVAAAGRVGLPVLGQPRSVLAELAGASGLRFFAEGFPDRRYLPDGRLVPRTDPRALLHDPAEIEAHVVRLAESGVETLCIHGDDPNAVSNVRLVRNVLQRHGFVLKGLG